MLGILDKIPPTDLQGIGLGILLSLLALRIAFGLRIYDKRNDELYNDLISRGRKLEEEMGIATGIFKGRLKPHKRDFPFMKKHSHGRALGLIYSSVFMGWGLLLFWYLINGFLLLG